MNATTSAVEFCASRIKDDQSEVATGGQVSPTTSPPFAFTAAVAAVVLSCIPVIVGLSRLYRGMHYPSDVLAGALTGGLWLLLVITTLLPRQRARKLQRR